MSAPSVGVVVNPVAGMGGRVGLHGTDGANLARARERGAEPVAPHRALVALQALSRGAPRLTVFTVNGDMGGAHLPTTDWEVIALDAPARATTGADTSAAVSSLVQAGVGLVLFVGGDGTARDVVQVTRTDVPVLGVPAGVKMHSSVFATGPRPAGELAARFLLAPVRVGTRPGEVVDRDENGLRIHATARVPASWAAVQRAKAGTPADDDAGLAALGRELAAETRPGTLYLLGPGTSVGQVSAALGVASSPLGVDAILDGRLVALDASEAQLLDLLTERRAARLLLGVIGGQGFLLGRGNQQLSSAVLAAIGPENVDVICGAGKIAALDEPILLVDLDDDVLAARFAGYRRVRNAPGRSTVVKVVNAATATTTTAPLNSAEISLLARSDA